MIYIVTNIGAGNYGSGGTLLTTENIFLLSSDDKIIYQGSNSVIVDDTTIRRSALTGDVLADLDSNILTIAPGSVNNSKISDVHWSKVYGNPSFLETETDPTVPAHVKSITNTNISNWNNAYANMHDAVTLAGENYLFLSGQKITAGSINLASTNVSGLLPSNKVSGLASVATSGDYNDLINKPSISDTVTRLRGTASGSFVSGDITLLAGSGINISQSSNNITITNSSPVYTLPQATSAVLGGIKIISNTVQSVSANSVTSTSGRTYGIQLNSDGQAVVNVPWTDSSTTYTGSNGINVSGTVISPVYGTSANTIAQGNDSRIINGQTAYSWGNHAGLYRPISWTPTLQEVSDEGNITTNELIVNNNTSLVKRSTNYTGSAGLARVDIVHNPTEYGQWSSSTTGALYIRNDNLGAVGGNYVFDITFYVGSNGTPVNILASIYTTGIGYAWLSRSIPDTGNTSGLLKIRHHKAGNTVALVLGDEDSVWTYPKFIVNKISYSNGNRTNETGWVSGRTTDLSDLSLSGYSNIINTAQNLQEVTNVGNTTNNSMFLTGGSGGRYTEVHSGGMKVYTPTSGGAAMAFGNMINSSNDQSLSQLGFYTVASSNFQYGYAGEAYNNAVLKWTNSYFGIGIGSTSLPTAPLDVVGDVRLRGLSGTGNRMVVASANGTLSTQDIPSGGGTYTGSTSIILNGTSFERSALTGDVTSAQNSNVTTIGNSVVSYAKMQNMTTNRLLGRGASGTGIIQEVSLGSNLSLSSSAILSVTGLSNVATSGDYTDLINTPTIPDAVNLSSGSNISITGTYPNLTINNTYSLPIATSTVLGGVKQGSNVTISGDGTISVSAPYTHPTQSAINVTATGVEVMSAVAVNTLGHVTSFTKRTLPTASGTTTGVLSSANWTTFNNKQNLLVSGTNIKTINGNTLLGSGDMTVGGVSVKNAGGTEQWLTSDGNRDIRFAGAGDTTISFNAATRTVTITSIPGSGGGGAVTSFNGRTGGVTSQAGDYSLGMMGDVSISSLSNLDILQYKSSSGEWENVTLSTSVVPEGANLYFTNARSRSSISLTTTGTSGAATYNNSTGVLNIPQYSNTTYSAGNGLTLSGTTFSLPITVSGTGSYVQSVTQTSNGLTVTLGTPPDTNTTYSNFTRTVSGLVPNPGGSTTTRFLREDGTWVVPTNTTYTNMTLSELNTGTATTARAISSKTLNDWLNGKGYITQDTNIANTDLTFSTTRNHNVANQILRFNNASLFEITGSNGAVSSFQGRLALRNTASETAIFNIDSLTANATYSFPDKSGTVALLDDIPTGVGNFATNNLTFTGNRVHNMDSKTLLLDDGGGFTYIGSSGHGFGHEEATGAFKLLHGSSYSANIFPSYGNDFDYQLPHKSGVIALLDDISSSDTNIGNSNLTLTSNRTLDGDGRAFTITNSSGFYFNSNSPNGTGFSQLNMGGFNIYNSVGLASLSVDNLTTTRTYSFPDKSGTIALVSDVVNIGNSDLSLDGNRVLTGNNNSLSIIGLDGVIISDRWSQGFGIPDSTSGDFEIRGYPSGTKVRLTMPALTNVRQSFQPYNGEVEVLQTETPGFNPDTWPATLVYGTQKYGKIEIDPFTMPTGNPPELQIYFPEPFKTGAAVVLQCNSGVTHRVGKSTSLDSRLREGFSIFLMFEPGIAFTEKEEIYYIVNGH